MWRLFLALSLSLSFVFTAFDSPVGAEQELILKRVEVDIWPEYDRPDVLVMYTIYLSDQTPLPAKLSLRIPLAAGQFSALAVMVEGTLRDVAPQDYQTEIEGSWLRVDFTARMPVIRLEYYDPNLKRLGDKRDFLYLWPGDYAVETMKIQVQQPATATQMKISLKRGVQETDMGSGQPGADGLFYFGTLIGDVKAGQSVQVRLAYLKPDDNLSVNLQPVQPSQPITLQTSGRITLVQLLPWVLFAVIGFLGLGGGFWYWRTGRYSRVSHHQHIRKTQGVSDEEVSEIYCHQCGRRAHKGDLFCRTCGAKLHS